MTPITSFTQTRLRRVLVSAILLAPFPSAAFGQVKIDFEDLVNVPVLNQYASRGVTFNGPLARDYAQTPGFAHGGNRAVELCFAAEFCSSPLTINFTAGQARAKLWVGSSFPLVEAATVVLRALDQNGAVVGQASIVLGPSTGPIPMQTPLQISLSQPVIRKLDLSYAPGSSGQAFNSGLVVDDVEFSSAGPPPVCTTNTNPVLTLSQPVNGTMVQTNVYMMQGNVVTAVPLDSATLTVVRPGGTVSSNLLGTIVQQTGGPFGPISNNGGLSPGVNTVTVEVRNCRGVARVSRTVTFSPIISGTRFRVAGMEFTQATQDLQNSVPLIAGKPTMVRLYLSVSGPTASIANVSASLLAERPGSTAMLELRSTNAITADQSTNISPKRLNLSTSLNFALPSDWFRAGTLHFRISRTFVSGEQSNLPCDGCATFSNYFPFQPTRPLNLVLAPFLYAPPGKTPLSADLLFTPAGALQYLNNVYPLGGQFPSDSAGINLIRILPMRTTSRALKSDDDKDDFLCELSDLYSDLKSHAGGAWPKDFHLLGVLPFGGGGLGSMPGNVAFADTWAPENGPVPAKNFESYGALWAHELGHNFGREHVSNSHGEMPPTDSGFPYLHGGIGEPGLAIVTEWWNSSPFLIAPGIPSSGPFNHAHDFMSYGSVNDLAEHTNSWVSPYTYDALYQAMRVLPQFSIASPPAEKLVVVGRINASGKAVLRPFRVETTQAGPILPGVTGEFSIELKSSSGETLLVHRFYGQRLQESGTVALAEFVPWDVRTRSITLKRGTITLSSRTVSAHKPWVRVVSPKNMDLWGAKGLIKWEAGDDDHTPLTFTVLYNTGNDDVWLPLATGLMENKLSVDTATLAGSSRARVRVRVTDGVNTAQADSEGGFQVPSKPPLVAILRPESGAILQPGEDHEFVAAAYDFQEGMLPPDRLTWTSDRDGAIGQGARFTPPRRLTPGKHVLTVTVKSTEGASTTSTVNVVFAP